MVDTFQAVIVVAIALVPGALYFWAFERQTGRWGIGLSDRVLRFVGLSALFHAAVAPVSYWFWAHQWPKLREGESVSLGLWGLAIAYAAVPLAGGTIIGFATHRGLPWARWFVGPHPAPRAWDYLFEHEPDGYVRMRLKSGTWIAGLFAEFNGQAPYTAGYPEPQDLLLPATVKIDPETGETPLDQDGRVMYERGALLVRWDEVEYLQFFEEPGSENHGNSRRTAPPPSPQGVRRRLHLIRQGRIGARTTRRARPGPGGEGPRAQADERQEVAERRRRRRKEFVGGYTSSGKPFSELNLPIVVGPGPGAKRREPSPPADKK
jgi:hypothetical protein